MCDALILIPIEKPIISESYFRFFDHIVYVWAKQLANWFFKILVSNIWKV